MSERLMELVHGDTLEVLPHLSPEFAHAVVTDPPYGLGFMGKQWDHGTPGVPFWEAIMGAMKPGAHLLVFSGTRTWHRTGVAIEDAGFEMRDCLMWLYGQGFPKSYDVGKNSDDPRWEGWGTALKPAWEPIILARKPMTHSSPKTGNQIKATTVECAQEHGTGALNIDGTRVSTEGESFSVPQSDPDKRRGVVGTDLGITRASKEKFQQAQRESIQRTEELGRWPANLMLNHLPGCEQVGEQSERVGGGARATSGFVEGYERGDGWSGGEVISPVWDCEEGCPARLLDEQTGELDGASRFFYCAKAPKSERNQGLPEGVTNDHPTVKPLDLMRYLVRLVTPPGGIVLDPFMGSGTTALAALAEGMAFVGVDKEAEYVELARARVNGALTEAS